MTMVQQSLFAEECAQRIALDLHERSSHDRLKEAREYAKLFAYSNVHEEYSYCVSSDDVNAGLGIEKSCDYSNNCNGAIFRGKEWVFVRYIKSRREGSHARRICLYTLRELVHIAGEKKNGEKK